VVISSLRLALDKVMLRAARLPSLAAALWAVSPVVALSLLLVDRVNLVFLLVVPLLLKEALPRVARAALFWSVLALVSVARVDLLSFRAPSPLKAVVSWL
jgi:hypothetical protein